MFLPTVGRSIAMSTLNNRMHIRVERKIAGERASPHSWRRPEAPPTPSKMFVTLGLALCAILYMVGLILLFAKFLGH
jgi:hypothetical protein